MRITPLDIRKQEFRKTMRGLDSDEVYAFLGTVADEYEAVLSDNKRLREHIVQLEERLKEFKSMETNLRNTLMTAEKITTDAKENARREADLIVRGAEVEATQSAEAIRAHTQKLRREILELKTHKDNYVTRLRTLLDSHRNVVDGFEEDFAEVDREIEAIGRKIEEDTHTPPPASRISRERIEENFAHREPEAKVTWDDDQPREDVERPTVPRPGEWEQQNPERQISAPEDGETGPGETAFSPQLEFGTVGDAVTPGGGASADASPSGEPEEYIDEREEMTEEELEGEALARDVVAHSLEARMYPDPHLNGDAPSGGAPAKQSPPQAAPQQSVFAPEAQAVASAKAAPGAAVHGTEQSQSPEGSTGTAMKTEPSIPAVGEKPAADSDGWKSYEVKESKQDWSSYEVPRKETEAAPQPPKQSPSEPQPPQQSSSKPLPTQQPAAKMPSDNEVEAALSGLTEMASEKPAAEGAPPAETAKVSPVKAQPAATPADQAITKDAKETAKKQKPEADDDQAWSLEDLRKNLTNMDRDD